MKNGYHSTVSDAFLFFRMLLRFRRLILMFVSLSVLGFSGLTATYAQNSLPNLGDAASEAFSPAQERKLGKKIMQYIRRDRDYLDDALLQEYLNGIGNRLLSFYPQARDETGQDFFFFAVRDASINAFALPGGYVGFHSALILETQRESELAAVMAHEIGHVAQRHIARMLGKQKQDMLIPIAAAILAAAAANSSGGDASAAILMGGVGIAQQRQLNYSRSAEREADRIGFKILRAAGYDLSGMTVFFGRMQDAHRAYDDSAPSYLRTHPMTTERIADIEARIREQPKREKYVDSLDFYLARARIRVLEDMSANGLYKVMKQFKSQIDKNKPKQTAASFYGLALVAQLRGKPDLSRTLLKQARDVVGDSGAYSRNRFFASLSVDLLRGQKQYAQALKAVEQARKAFPASRSFAMQYAQTLYAQGQFDKAERFLRDCAQAQREEPAYQQQLAKTYSAMGRRALMHMSLAEAYGLGGDLTSALQQLKLARNAPDASYYELSIADVRERHWQKLRLEQMKERKR